MVGVPGKSKGCSTCRKRKKGCDLQRPSCGQCLRSGNLCGGYQRDLTFVHHSAKVVSGGSRAPLDARPQPDLSISSAGFRRVAFGQQFQDLFWDLYMPQGDCEVKDEMVLKCGHPVNWTIMIPQISSDETAFKLAFLAVSAARVGRDRNDRRLVQESLKTYGKALRDLQSALYDPQRMYSDGTLVACMLLNLYEIFEGSDQKTLAWISHSQGAARLVELRGVGRHTGEESNFLFCGARLPIIFAAIVRRQATFLSSPDWLTKPWEAEGIRKTWSDRLYDVMAGIPSILELYDLVDGQVDSPTFKQHGQKLMRRLIELCRETDKALQTWYAATREDVKPQMIQSAPSSSRHTYPFATRYHFKNHLFAQAVLMYWMSCLILDSVICDLNDILVPRKRIEWQPMKENTPMPTPGAGIDKVEIDLAALQSRVSPRHHALCIARSIPYFLLPDMRALGVNYLKFPMGISFAFFCGTLHSGCRLTWKLDKEARVQAEDSDIGKEDQKIIAWFTETLEDIEKRGMPTNWRFRASDSHSS